MNMNNFGVIEKAMINQWQWLITWL